MHGANNDRLFQVILLLQKEKEKNTLRSLKYPTVSFVSRVGISFISPPPPFKISPWKKKVPQHRFGYKAEELFEWGNGGRQGPFFSSFLFSPPVEKN